MLAFAAPSAVLFAREHWELGSAGLRRNWFQAPLEGCSTEGNRAAKGRALRTGVSFESVSVSQTATACHFALVSSPLQRPLTFLALSALKMADTFSTHSASFHFFPNTFKLAFRPYGKFALFCAGTKPSGCQPFHFLSLPHFRAGASPSGLTAHFRSFTLSRQFSPRGNHRRSLQHVSKNHTAHNVHLRTIALHNRFSRFFAHALKCRIPRDLIRLERTNVFRTFRGSKTCSNFVDCKTRVYSPKTLLGMIS